MQANIDSLHPERGLIQLSSDASVDIDVDDYKLTRLHGDVLLCEFIDVSEDGDSILRNGIFVPIHSQTKAWRKARVVLAGTEAKWTKEGEIVMFPHNYGVEISKIEVGDYGKVKQGVFLNESRIFGACEPVANEDNEK
jgi:hypothetical protein